MLNIQKFLIKNQIHHPLIRTFSSKDYLNRNKNRLNSSRNDLFNKHMDIVNSNEEIFKEIILNRLNIKHPFQLRIIYDSKLCAAIKSGNVPDDLKTVLTKEDIDNTVETAEIYQEASSKIITDDIKKRAKEGDTQSAEKIITDRLAKKCEVRDLQENSFKNTAYSITLERIEKSEEETHGPAGGDILGASNEALMDKHKKDPEGFLEGASRKRDLEKVTQVTREHDNANLKR